MPCEPSSMPCHAQMRTTSSWSHLTLRVSSITQSAAARARAAYNAAIFGLSMSFERAALVFGGAVVPALTGRNFFFPNKPQAFHDLCADYARYSALCQLTIFALSGPSTDTLFRFLPP